MNRSALDYGQREEALWHAYQTMQLRQATTDGKRQGAHMVTDVTRRVTSAQADVINRLDRAYVRQGHATARLFKAYTRTFESHPYVNH